MQPNLCSPKPWFRDRNKDLLNIVFGGICKNNQPIKRIVCEALPYIKTPFKNKNGVFNFFDKK